MTKTVINSLKEFAALEGITLDSSDYMKITQAQINKFADATMDHQWIHIDEERAKKESQFGSTIAHGYLTLSILPPLWNEIIEVNNVKMLVNYGINNFKFSEAVRVNDEVRLTVKVMKVQDLRGICKAEMRATLEIKNRKKPAYAGTIIFLYHFK
ncbi:MAG: MaoC family dehydratase [Bacteroidales bacterium]|nr:MaoC family dehydratase [Bacteroidales bacterium]